MIFCLYFCVLVRFVSITLFMHSMSMSNDPWIDDESLRIGLYSMWVHHLYSVWDLFFCCWFKSINSRSTAIIIYYWLKIRKFHPIINTVHLSSYNLVHSMKSICDNLINVYAFHNFLKKDFLFVKNVSICFACWTENDRCIFVCDNHLIILNQKWTK